MPVLAVVMLAGVLCSLGRSLLWFVPVGARRGTRLEILLVAPALHDVLDSVEQARHINLDLEFVDW